MSLQSSVFENGEWVTRDMTTTELIRKNGHSHRPTIGRQPLVEPPICGLLTRTIVDSPVTRWILPVRLRSSSFNDVAFIGVSHCLPGSQHLRRGLTAKLTIVTISGRRRTTSKYMSWMSLIHNFMTLGANATFQPKFGMQPSLVQSVDMLEMVLRIVATQTRAALISTLTCPTPTQKAAYLLKSWSLYLRTARSSFSI